MKSIIMYTIMCAGLCLLTGCRSAIYVQADAGEKGYILESGADGWVAYLEHDLESVHEASAAGLKTLKITPREHRMDKISAYTAGQFADGEKVSIQLDRVSDNVTEMKIEVGALNPPERIKSIFTAVVSEL